jgi:glutathione S-transferase
MTGYSQAAEKRGPGFFIQSSACGVLLLGALGAILWRLIHAT